MCATILNSGASAWLLNQSGGELRSSGEGSLIHNLNGAFGDIANHDGGSLVNRDRSIIHNEPSANIDNVDAGSLFHNEVGGVFTHEGHFTNGSSALTNNNGGFLSGVMLGNPPLQYCGC